MKLTFKKIVRENVFSDDFLHMVKDNEIEFHESAGHRHVGTACERDGGAYSQYGRYIQCVAAQDS